MSKGRVVVVLAVLGLIWMGSGGDDSERKPSPGDSPVRKVFSGGHQVSGPKVPAHERVSVRIANWQMGGFGSIAIMSFEITNGNPYPVKDVSVRCDFYGDSGTTLDTHLETVFKIVPPREKITVRDLNLGFVHQQTSSAACRILAAVQAGPEVAERKPPPPAPKPKPASLKGVY